MNLNTLLAREFNYLQSSAGLTHSVQFMVRLQAFGPVHIETVIQSLRNESVRVLGLKRSLNKRMR